MGEVEGVGKYRPFPECAKASAPRSAHTSANAPLVHVQGLVSLSVLIQVLVLPWCVYKSQSSFQCLSKCYCPLGACARASAPLSAHTRTSAPLVCVQGLVPLSVLVQVLVPSWCVCKGRSPSQCSY